MRILLIVLLISVFTSCQQYKYPSDKPTPDVEIESVSTVPKTYVGFDDWSIVVIDSCEYIEVDMGSNKNRVYSLTHKGNCSNTIHPIQASKE